MNKLAAPERKMAPVQGWPQGIPWSLHLEAYAAYCKKWSPQPALIDLEGRNCRGGFGTDELDEFIPGWRERASEIAQLRSELAHAAAVSAAKDAEIAQLRADLIKSLADNKALRKWLEGDARCPCCDTTDACVEGCTFATDCPQDAERMAEVRALLAARKGEA